MSAKKSGIEKVFAAIIGSGLFLFVACAPTNNVTVPNGQEGDSLRSSENIRTYTTDYDTTFRAAIDTLRRMEPSGAKFVRQRKGLIILKKPSDAGTITIKVTRAAKGTTRVEFLAKDDRKAWFARGIESDLKPFFDELERLLGDAAVDKKTADAENANKAAGEITAKQKTPDKDPIKEKIRQKLQFNDGANFLDKLSYEDLALLDQRLETFTALSAEKDRLGTRCAACYIDLARLYHDDKRYNRSADALKIAISIDPDNAVAHCNLGEIYKHLALYDEAIRELRKAEQLDPEFPDTYINLGIIYDDYLADDRQALENYRRYLKLGGSHKQVSEWIAEIEAGF